MITSKKQPHPTDKRVGARVRARRLLLGMSQEKLADGLGLTFQQVQKYEKGANRIGSSRLQQIARILKCPVAFFFEGETETSGAVVLTADQHREDVFSGFLASTGGVRIAQVWNKIPAGQQGALVKLVEQMAEARPS